MPSVLAGSDCVASLGVNILPPPTFDHVSRPPALSFLTAIPGREIMTR
jgi:hypothetical protein